MILVTQTETGLVVLVTKTGDRVDASHTDRGGTDIARHIGRDRVDDIATQAPRTHS